MEKLKFIQDLQDIVNELTFSNDNSISFITEEELKNIFFGFYNQENTTSPSIAIDFLISRMQYDYDQIGILIKQRQQDIQEKLHQNESIMKITNALNNVGNMLDQTCVNSFPLSHYRQSLDLLIEELEEDYCTTTNVDLTDEFIQAGVEMSYFFNALELLKCFKKWK